MLKSLPLGGIETWLMHVLRSDRHSLVQHELLLMVEQPGAYEPEARRLGIPIHKIPHTGSWLRWFADLRKFLKAEGPFDVIHSHVAYGAGAPICAVAATAGVPSRIAHQHEAPSASRNSLPLRDRLVRRAAIALYSMTGARRIGISEVAIEEIAGRAWRRGKSSSVLLYGFDFSGFVGAVDRARRLRKQLGLRPTDRIIGHVGRFVPVKNHAFLLRTFARIAETDPDARLVIVGEGELEPELRALANELGVAGAVRFAGSTQDIAAYMALFDLFLLPSFSEGLGIVCVEAQAAGTPVLASDTVPRETVVLPGGVQFLSLTAGEDAWAERAAQVLRSPKSDPDEARRLVEQSAFGIDRCVRDLHDIYRQELGLGR